MNRMLGSLKWRGKNNDRLYLDYTINGKRFRPFYGVCKTDSESERRNLERLARLELDQLQRQVENGEFFDAQYPNYKQLVDFYWDKCYTKKEYIKRDFQSGASDYYKLMLTVAFLGDYPSDEIKRSDIKSFRKRLQNDRVWFDNQIEKMKQNPWYIYRKKKQVRNREWSTAYINRILAAIGQVYKFAITQEVWSFDSAPSIEQRKYGNIDLCINLNNPAHGLPKLKESPEKPVIPSLDQFRLFLDALPTTIKYMALFGAHTALRPRNIIELKWDQINIQDEFVIIDSYKGSSARNAPPLILRLHPELLELLKILEKSKQSGEIYVFPKSFHTPYKDFRGSWHRACDTVSIKGFSFRNLRTAYVSWRIEEGVSIGLLQRALGHTTVNTTARFYNLAQHATDEIIKNQRSILKLIPSPDTSKKNKQNFG